MSYIVGKIKHEIFYNDANGFLVAAFRVNDASDDLKNKMKRSVTVTGSIVDLRLETLIKLEGNFVFHEKYGKEFKWTAYEYILPKENDDIIEFLSSNFIKGCGKKTAEKIVKKFGSDALSIIKENKFALDNIEGINPLKRDAIYESLINYSEASDVILKLQNLGFTIEESGRIYRKFKSDIITIIDTNLYLFNEVIDFKRLDSIFLNNYQDKLDKRRVKAIILESMSALSNEIGSIYYDLSLVYNAISKLFNIYIEYDLYLKYMEELKSELLIVIDGTKCYLQKNYQDEVTIANLLKKIDQKEIKKIDFKEKITELEKKINITYNDEQKKAITTALNSNISIISGGPGTGKTTIINAIVKLYIDEYKLSPLKITEQIALLAPTGRASKRMSMSTGLKASTIHRFLKWNKDTDEFMINENNKNIQELIIVDEASMIDNNLFASLLKGIHSYVKLILVGDVFQLPSVGPGFLLSDMINSELFNYTPLNYIYRQSDNSYIPYLAREIKNKDLQEEFLSKKDDYNFLKVENNRINATIKKIIEEGIKRGYDENNLQILAPKYRGEIGIDNLNKMLCELFNPDGGITITYGDTTYKEGDKVLQLVNDADNNVFNGDIGFIRSIDIILSPFKKEIITIDFDGNIVTLPRKDLKNIRHAYAISIHKSQGSEFDHVIMPISFLYGNMLYNKLLYTGVSRAKKSLILIGDAKAFYQGVLNDYGSERNTTLKERLKEIFIDCEYKQENKKKANKN